MSFKSLKSVPSNEPMLASRPQGAAMKREGGIVEASRDCSSTNNHSPTCSYVQSVAGKFVSSVRQLLHGRWLAKKAEEAKYPSNSTL
ncbi:hypothetical protein Mapa_009583 [Marchantia paleacea]|nr:hypothetical protein Mapa_009583 [Marchantia paleacea]